MLAVLRVQAERWDASYGSPLRSFWLRLRPRSPRSSGFMCRARKGRCRILAAQTSRRARWSASSTTARLTGSLVSYRVHAPALVWMRRTANGWQRYVIEKDFLRLEAGGAAYDIDGDGDLDVVFGEDIRGKNSTGGKIPHRTSTLMFRGRATSSSRRGRTSITIRYSLISKERASLSLFSGISARRRCSSRRSLQIRRPRLPGRWRRST
jgi:hypothetical protein